MDRRTFLAGTGALLAAPRVVEGQQTGKVWRIGYLELKRGLIKQEKCFRIEWLRGPVPPVPSPSELATAPRCQRELRPAVASLVQAGGRHRFSLAAGA